MQPPFALDSNMFGKSFAPFSAEATRGLDTSRLGLLRAQGSGSSMSNTVCRPLSGEQIDHMLRPQWRGHLSQAPSNEYLGRLRDVSAQKAFAEEAQREQERGGFQLLPPCNWRDPLEASIVRVIR